MPGPDATAASTDRPVVADYDGDGKTNLAIFRDGNWFFAPDHESGIRHYQWGLAGDLPVPGDYDGDGKTDIAVYRDGVWYQLRSTGTVHVEQFGLAGDIPAQLLR